MKKSLLLALTFATGVYAGSYEAPKFKMPSTPDSGRIETKMADWQEMNDTKLTTEEVPVRQLASDAEEVLVDPKDRGPSSNSVDKTVTDPKAAMPDVSPEKIHQDKAEFWKYERTHHRNRH